MRISSAESLAVIAKIELPANSSLAEIRQAGTPPISSLIRAEDKTECYKFIMGMILMINQFLGVAWSDYQLEEAAKTFYAKHYYWHQLDMKSFINKCRAMEYDKLLSVNQWSPFMLMNWAAQYDAEWLQVSIEQSLQAHDAATFDPERRDELYKLERDKIIDGKRDKERIKSMQETINRMNEKHKKK